jgi:hydroxymethylbilane synthase
VRKSASGPPPAAMDLGRDLAAAMIAEGADMLMGEQTH